MELQEWFITHPWAYYLYWILGIIFLIIIYKLPDVELDGKKWIIRLPSDGLGDAVDTKQGLKTKPKGEMTIEQDRSKQALPIVES